MDDIDILDEESIQKIVKKYFTESSIDILIIATGLLQQVITTQHQ